MEIVIKISEETVNKIKDNAMFAGTIPSEILWDITSAIVNGTPIPDNMTNGDVIKAMFPNGKVIERDEATGYEQMLDDKYSYCSWFDGVWWNAPY